MCATEGFIKDKVVKNNVVTMISLQKKKDVSEYTHSPFLKEIHTHSSTVLCLLLSRPLINDHSSSLRRYGTIA